MIDKIIEYLESQVLKETKYCESLGGSDSKELCRYKYVYPIGEMVEYLKADALNNELLSYTPDKLSEL